MKRIEGKKIKVVIYEALLIEFIFFFLVINNIPDFKKISDVIMENRIYYDLENITSKVYSKHLLGCDN